MGLDIKHCLSDERHYGAFECIICQNVVDLDALVTTTCSHCFCKKCLVQWLLLQTQQSSGEGHAAGPERAAAPKCPTCNADLLYAHLNPQRAPASSASMMIGDHAVTVQPLSVCQPLAFRVLKRVKVACPLQGDGVHCNWQGDYEDLQRHLLSQSAHTGTGPIPMDVADHDVGTMEADAATDGGSDQLKPAEPTHDESLLHKRALERQRAMALSFKEQANEQFGSGQFATARDLYSKAISILQPPDQSTIKRIDDNDIVNDDETKQLRELMSALYCNRSATLYLMKDYRQAEMDASCALQMDPSYAKAYVRKARALIQLGHFAQACEVLENGLNRVAAGANSVGLVKKAFEEARSLRDAMAEAERLIEQQQFASAKTILGRILGETTAPNVLLATAQADLAMGLLDSAQRFALQVLKMDPKNADANAVRGHVFVLRNEVDSGIQWLQQALRFDPDSTTIRVLLKECLSVRSIIKDAKDKTFHRQFQMAVDLFTKAIASICLLPPKSALFGWLYTERAAAHLRMKDYSATLKDCAVVLYHQEDHVEAWLLRFQALHALGRDEEARTESARLLEHWGSQDDRIRQAHYKADFEFRRQQRPDFYAMLGVSPLASEREIKKAYRQRALELHPDRWVGSEYTDEQRKAAEQQFQLLGQGLEILTDDFKRQLYDEGYDQEGIQQRVEAANQAAHRRSDQYQHRH